MNLRNWLIGACIIEYEQGGADRAEYGAGLLKALADDLRHRSLKGLSQPNLKGFRKIALTWPQLLKGQTVSDFFETGKGQTVSGLLEVESEHAPSAESGRHSFPAMEERAHNHPGLEWQDEKWAGRLFATLSFSHLVELARIDDPLERAFYEIECMMSGWSVRELKRQRDSMLFQRVGLSKDKDAVMALAKKGRLIDSPETIFRDPMVMEFLGLEQRVAYGEPDLEKAIVNHLEAFMRELGRDFCFVDRQFPIRVGNEVYHLDLLFFHRGLRCLTAVDLKIGRFQHTDAGQMNFYLNYLREELTKPE